jgi:hypothetical protein
MKRRRNPSQALIAQYGKRLPYLVQALDKAMRYADGKPAWPPGIDCPSMTWMIEDHGLEQREALDARRQALIEVARMIMEASWVTPSMIKNKKSPYIQTVANWYTGRSITLPEDVPKTQETLREFHEMVLSGVIKGEAANIDRYHSQQDLARFLRAFKKGVTQGGIYEQEGCIRVAELGKYVLFRIDDYETGEVVFKNTNWCVRCPNAFENYGPPYFMVVNTKVEDGQDDRFCLLHNDSKQVKDIDNDQLPRRIQLEIKPFLEYVFGRWACKYNMTDGGGDLDIGDQWWPLDATTPFEAVGEIIDVLWGVSTKLVEISESISLSVQEYMEDEARKQYKKEHDGDDDGFEKWYDEWRESDQASKDLDMFENDAIQQCDVLTQEAFNMFGLTYDQGSSMDYMIPKIFGTSWIKMMKLLNIRPNIGNHFTVGGNPRFNRNHTTPKMEAWAERSIDKFIAMLPDEDDFSRYIRRRDAGVWGSLAGARRHQ